MAMTRTQDEIVARYHSLDAANDIFGTRHNDLIVRLDFEHAKPLLRDGVTATDWADTVARYSDPVAEAREYLPFAMAKATDHRGLSAQRSIDHMREWAWLSGDDAFARAIDEPHTNYGAPILYAVAAAIGALDVWNEHATPGLQRMAEGLECDPAGCNEGCGR